MSPQRQALAVAAFLAHRDMNFHRLFAGTRPVLHTAWCPAFFTCKQTVISFGPVTQASSI